MPHVKPKDRMIAALQGTAADSLAAAPAYLSLFLADFERALYADQYRRRLRGLVRYPVDHQEDTLFRARALVDAYAIFKARPDWICVHRGAGRAWAARTDIILDSGFLFYHDRESGLRAPLLTSPLPHGDPHLSAQSAAATDLWDTSAQLRGTDDVDAAWPIEPAAELLARGDFDLPAQVVAELGDDQFLYTILDTPYSDAYDLLGFQGLMTTQIDRRPLLHHLLARKLQQSEQVMAAWAAVGIDGVYVEEVFSGADMISPRSYDEFVFEYNQAYFRTMRSLGLLPIHYVCGDALPRLDRISRLDIAAVAVEESKKTFRLEIDQVIDRVAGRVAVFGNIDTVRYGLHGSMDEMAAEVRRQARLGARARGFVLSTGSPFPLDTNPRVIDTLVATAHALPAGGP